MRLGLGICEQLAEDPAMQPQRLREIAGELGYARGKSPRAGNWYQLHRMPADSHSHDRLPAPVPVAGDADALREAVPHCRACDLWEAATQAVLGEGPRGARVMLVGEQPGDREDIEGHPFVGPAGGVLDRALAAAELPRADVYLTNVVKHFRYRKRGKRRIHQRPDRWQVRACRPWLDAELALIRPEVIVCLGVTAAAELIGPGIRIGRDHGRPIESDLATHVTVAAHPSAILRAPDADARARSMGELVDDLQVVGGWLRD
jgi:uracil-DNA glycosylase